MPLSTLVLFLTSLLATISLLLADPDVRQRLLAMFFLRRVILTLLDAAGNSLGHDDEDDDDARRACGHRDPPPWAAAMAASADDLTARFLSSKHMAAPLFLQDFIFRRKLLRNPCLKALVALGPLIAPFEQGDGLDLLEMYTAARLCSLCVHTYISAIQE